MRPNKGQHLGRSGTVEDGGIESGTGLDERIALGQRQDLVCLGHRFTHREHGLDAPSRGSLNDVS